MRADLAGIDPGDVDLEIRGRELILAGHRRPSEDQERLYQQLEIEHGPFRRVVALGAEVDADAAKAVYEDGMLVVELPVVGPADAHTVPIEPGRRSDSAATAASREHRHRDARRRRPRRGDGRAAAAGAAARAAAARHGHLPRHADAAGGRPGALGAARQRRARRRPHARDGGQPRPRLGVAGAEQLYDYGVVGTVARMLKVPDGTLRILVEGGQRVHIDEWVSETPYLVARISEAPDIVREGPELTALMRNVQQTFSRIIEEVPYLPEELQLAVANLDDPSALSHLIAGSLRIDTTVKQELLEERDVTKRLRRLSEILANELEVAAMGARIQSQVQSELDKSQREYLLRQQLKAIQEELGERDPAEAEVEELREQLAQIKLPEDVRKVADRELSRLERLPQAAAEHGVIRTYLEWIASLPWDASTEDNLDLGHAREVLDADHYDIEQVKDRIIEFLAVRRLKPDARGSILCFVGPPGVGKTSLGRSIASALERKFERISVGGMRDEAEIRGHRRTYIGAMPGVIIRALRDAGSNNPLFMIDEIDKMGADYRGDPASAMLEVLDPEQNATFRDHYLDMPFDLSRAMFITTANTLDTVPGPLRDRMEIIQLAGYTEEEKLQIAKRYLVPRQIERNGLKKSQIAFTDAGLRAIISDYTREAGVRNLEREIGSVCRKVGAPGGRGHAQAQGVGHRAARARAARPPALPARRRQAAHARARGGDRPGVDAGRRRRAVRRGDRDARQPRAPAAPDRHRSARRRHARVGDGRAVLRPRARARARARAAARLLRHARHPPARAVGRDAEGRPERRHHDGDGADVARHRAARCARTPR